MMESGEPTVECPYDNTHIICEKFISKHLLRCRENHRTHKRVACRFDKTHLIPKPELPYHLTVCRSRYILDRELQLKASKGVDGLHCGDVIGPKIVTNYDSGDDVEEWGSEPASDTPVALFNRREIDYDNNEGDAPRTIPGANYPSRLPRNAAAVSGEETCRKYPIAPSKVAQISEMSKNFAQPVSSSQVFQFSLSQTCPNPGFGRGQGVNQQDLKTVGAHFQGTTAADYADFSGPVYMEKASEHLDQANGFRLPKGRGSLHGTEQLRRPGSSSFVQGFNYSSLPNASRMEGQTGGDKSNKLFQQDSIRDSDSNIAEADDVSVSSDSNAFERAVRKLKKKLRQLTILEQKLSAGISLNEEEKSKLEKKEEIVTLIESISKHL